MHTLLCDCTRGRIASPVLKYNIAFKITERKLNYNNLTHGWLFSVNMLHFVCKTTKISVSYFTFYSLYHFGVKSHLPQAGLSSFNGNRAQNFRSKIAYLIYIFYTVV